MATLWNGPLEQGPMERWVTPTLTYSAFRDCSANIESERSHQRLFRHSEAKCGGRNAKGYRGAGYDAASQPKACGTSGIALGSPK